MNETDTHTYTVETFSPDRETVVGPADLGEQDALAYLAQRMADQHRGGLSPDYWRGQARIALAEAAGKPGVACIRRVSHGRGIIVTAEALPGAAAFQVRVFPLFDDDGATGEHCAAFDHPRLRVAMREAGLRAERWLHESLVREAQERGEVVGFAAEIDARLTAPLLSGDSIEEGGERGRVESYAPRGGCPVASVRSAEEPAAA